MWIFIHILVVFTFAVHTRDGTANSVTFNIYNHTRFTCHVIINSIFRFSFLLCKATLRRIDFSGNRIEEIEDGAFSKLLLLEELSLAENRLLKLPVLPPKLTTFNANQNRIKSRGIKANAFKVSKRQ